jgi:hypothetical protein
VADCDAALEEQNFGAAERRRKRGWVNLPSIYVLSGLASSRAQPLPKRSEPDLRVVTSNDALADIGDFKALYLHLDRG